MGERNEGKDNNEAAQGHFGIRQRCWEGLSESFWRAAQGAKPLSTSQEPFSGLHVPHQCFGDRVVLRFVDSMTFRLPFR